MRLSWPGLILVASCACATQSEMSSGEGTEGGGSLPEFEPLPGNSDLLLALASVSRFTIYAECPAQDSAHLRVALTAPEDADVTAARVVQVEIDDAWVWGPTEAPVTPSGDDVVEAGERGVLVFNVPMVGPTAECESTLGELEPAPARVGLDIHGERFEVVGEIGMWCDVPAPHTCD